MANRDVKKERFREFLAEAEDILNSMGKGLLKLGKGVKTGIIDPAALNGIFRSAHTLKGMSGVFDFIEMGSLSHALEDTLDLLRMGRISLTDDVLDCIMATHELLLKIVASRGERDFTSEIDTAKQNLSRSYQIKKPITNALKDIDKEFLSVLTEYEEHRFRENLRDNRNIFLVNVGFPITSFDKGYVALTELLKTESEVIATLPSSRTNHEMLFFDILVGTSRNRDYIRNLAGTVAEADARAISEGSSRPESVREPVLELIKSKATSDTEKPRETLRRGSNSVRVNIGKLDNIMNIVSELFIVRTRITALSEELKRSVELSASGTELSRTEKLLERKLSELRDSVLDLRMVPIGQLFSRFETFINKLSRETGKEIRMITYGDETEIDKLIIEELADPLMHIIRNVVDHGIESSSVREALGKTRAGTITLSAYQKGNHVIVEVKDDGAGIDDDFVREKAVDKGIVSRDYVNKLSRQETLELLFMPGFSTRDAVSEISGRGVGMDVVKDNITRLSGVIDIDTVKGKGARFILTIPVTLAIIQALIVEDCGERYAVPLSSVLEIVELHGDSLPDGPGGFRQETRVNGRAIQSVRLSRFFGKESGQGIGSRYGIMVGLAEHRLCIIVDRLVEELDVVIKPLSRLLKVSGIAGATDIGDKGTILVLDVTGILEQTLKERNSFVRA